MKVLLLTSFSEETGENNRIKDELAALGHEFAYFQLNDFSFEVRNNFLILEEILSINPDVVILRGVLNSIKPIATVVSHLKNRGVRVFDNNLLNHLYSIDKISDILKLSSTEGIPLPDTFYARSFEKYTEKASSIGYPVVVKSVRSGKGAGVYKLENEEELKTLILKLESLEKDPKSFILQKFIPYVHDLRVLIIGDFVVAMKRIPPEGDFRANFSLGGTVERFELDESTAELAKRALGAIGMSVGGVDILITDDGAKYVLEVNHSAGFTGMELATSSNIGKIYVEHALSNAK